MGYKRVPKLWCDCCGCGSEMVNPIQPDSLDEIKKLVLSCGWKINKQDQMICPSCQSKGKMFSDCMKFDV